MHFKNSGAFDYIRRQAKSRGVERIDEKENEEHGSEIAFDEGERATITETYSLPTNQSKMNSEREESFSDISAYSS